MKKFAIATCLLLFVLSVVSAQGKKEEAGSMMAADNAADKGFFDSSGLGPSVLPYTGEAAAQALASKNTVVYFFAATWCPPCRGAYRDIVANYSKFPADFRLVLVNYDTAKELKAKYGVTYQHTFVSIDAAGKALKTWNGSPTVADMISKAGSR